MKNSLYLSLNNQEEEEEQYHTITKRSVTSSGTPKNLGFLLSSVYMILGTILNMHL